MSEAGAAPSPARALRKTAASYGLAGKQLLPRMYHQMSKAVTSARKARIEFAAADASSHREAARCLPGQEKSLSDAKVVELMTRIAGGKQKAAIARDLGISRETLYQYLRAAA